MTGPPDYRKYIVKPEPGGRASTLLKGLSGSGKTYQYRTLHEAGMKILLADVENKPKVIEDLKPDIWLIRAYDFPVSAEEKGVMLSSTGKGSDLMRMFDFLRTPDHGYDAIYFDSLMRYANKLRWHLQYVNRLSGWDIWSGFKEKMEAMLEVMCSLASPTQPAPLHVIGTWGVEPDTTGALTPIVDGRAVGPRIDYWWDNILFLTKREIPAENKIEYLAYTQGTEKFTAKLSNPLGIPIPALLADPNLAKLLEKLNPKT